jgi:mitochondrial import receptor subunit TOM40
MEATEKQSEALDFFRSNAVSQRIADVYVSFKDRREALGLRNPGSMENIAKEVEKDVFLNNYTFTGLRADITKMFSGTPLFQLSHALSMGSQALPPYQFSALYGSPKVFMQGSIDNDFALQGRFNWRWTTALVTKTSVSVQPGGDQAMLQIENDYQGSDFTANIKAINPSTLEGGLTGIFMGDYLQSITPKLALGVSAMWQRAAMNQGPETLVSYAARYKSADWIASARLLAAGSIQASYWRRIAEKVEAGVDVSLQLIPAMAGGAMMGMPATREGVATIGAKYDFRQSTFRAQGDSQGRLACLLEKRVAPAVQLTFAGEIDHIKV